MHTAWSIIEGCFAAVGALFTLAVVYATRIRVRAQRNQLGK